MAFQQYTLSVMKIDFSKTYELYADILPFVTEESRKAMRKEADKIKPVYQLTLAEFFDCCKGDFSCAVKNKDNPTAGEVFWVEHFGDFLKEFATILERLSIKQTADQKQASAGCLPVEWQEGMLVFVRRYFGLRSFTEAEQVTIADYLLAKKDDYNSVIFDRNLSRIQTNKIRKK